MIEPRPFRELGQAEFGWLSARHHFSFGHYFDPARRGWGKLLVWNDDTIQPGTGFDMHGHRDMEIVTYVRSGAISHRDHLGNAGVTAAGDVQVMSAGKGILHEEFNRGDDVCTLFQIWIEPGELHVPPRWETRAFPKADRAGELVPLASGRPRDKGGEALMLHQDAAILGATLAAGQSVTYAPGKDRNAYLVAALGSVTVNGQRLGPRDGAAIRDEDTLTIIAIEDSEIVLADTP